MVKHLCDEPVCEGEERIRSSCRGDFFTRNMTVNACLYRTIQVRTQPTVETFEGTQARIKGERERRYRRLTGLICPQSCSLRTSQAF